MKLSDAIALGRVLLKPKAGTFQEGGEGCAMGMAYLARGVNFIEPVEEWNWMTFKLAGLPCGCKGRVMGGGCLFYPSVGLENAVDAIVHLFNFHVMTEKDWTLDQLIDWVRSVEPAEPAPAAEPVVAEAEAVRT